MTFKPDRHLDEILKEQNDRIEIVAKAVNKLIDDVDRLRDILQEVIEVCYPDDEEVEEEEEELKDPEVCGCLQDPESRKNNFERLPTRRQQDEISTSYYRCKDCGSLYAADLWLDKKHTYQVSKLRPLTEEEGKEQ